MSFLDVRTVMFSHVIRREEHRISTVIVANPEQPRQVFLNLFTNAADLPRVMEAFFTTLRRNEAKTLIVALRERNGANDVS